MTRVPAPPSSPPRAGRSYSGVTAPTTSPSGLTAPAGTGLVLGTDASPIGLSLVHFAAGVVLDPATAAGSTVFTIDIADAGSRRWITSNATGAAALEPGAT